MQAHSNLNFQDLVNMQTSTSGIKGRTILNFSILKEPRSTTTVCIKSDKILNKFCYKKAK